ncbi:MAG: hypothetical protein KKE20_01340 [Nanoarchaeota archaeon]|nr:hypothetical protein [Nanoarchaeota archaeon]
MVNNTDKIGPAERRHLEYMKMLAAQKEVEEARKNGKRSVMMDAGGVYNFPLFRVLGEVYGFEDDCMDTSSLTRYKDIKIVPGPGQNIADVRERYRRIIDINHLLGDHSQPPENALIIPVGSVIVKGRKLPVGPLGIIAHDYAGFGQFQPDNVMPAERFPEYNLPEYIISIASNDQVGARIIDLNILLRMNFDPNYKPAERKNQKDVKTDLEGRF